MPRHIMKIQFSHVKVSFTTFEKPKIIERILKYRNSFSEVFCKKGVLKHFAKFTAKHLYLNLFFNRVAD